MPTGSPKPSASAPETRLAVSDGALIMPFPAGTGRELLRDKMRAAGKMVLSWGLGRSWSHFTFLRSLPFSFPNQVCLLLVAVF